jgi:hypothetical protein
MTDRTALKQPGLSIADLFLRDAEHLKEQLLDSPTGNRLSEDIRVVPTLKLEALLPDLLEEIHAVLDIKIKDILVGSVKKLAELRDVLNKSRDQPMDVFQVPLTELTIHSTHNPYVEIFMGEQRISRVDLHILLDLKLDGVMLRLQAGGIHGMTAGRCQVVGTLKIAELTVASRKLIEVDLPALFSEGRPAPVADEFLGG